MPRLQAVACLALKIYRNETDHTPSASDPRGDRMSGECNDLKSFSKILCFIVSNVHILVLLEVIYTLFECCFSIYSFSQIFASPNVHTYVYERTSRPNAARKIKPVLSDGCTKPVICWLPEPIYDAAVAVPPKYDESYSFQPVFVCG